MANNIRPPKAPNLPLSPDSFVRAYFDQFASMLRVYFNQIDSYHTVTNAAIGNFQARTTQTLVGANTAKQIGLDTAIETEGVNLDVTTYRLSVMQSGRFLFSFDIAGVSSATRYIWFRLNGVDVVESTHNTAGSTTLNLIPSDYVEMYWASSSGADTLPATAATGFCPATPAVNLNVTFIST
jgi:hypothetical protein